ncbi:MAG: alpha/beta hydrolase [Rhodobacteraceae bacterium]|nr:MAG: alpha/beta hydrolase [Paracoccaceae bacterium]
MTADGGGAPAFGEGSTTLAPVAADGVRLRGAFAPGAGRGLVALLHGRTEFLEKYAPVAAALAERGFAVASVDWRGQGASRRPVGHPLKGHVDDFAEYQRDLAALLAAVPETPGPRVMVAHSMGGAIGLRALLAPGHGFDAAIFTAPMWGLTSSWAARRFGPPLARLASRLGFGSAYAPGGGREPYVLDGFEGNLLTGDAEEFERIRALTEAHPSLALAGPTYGWIAAAFAEMAALEPSPLETPSMVALGSEERVTSPAAIGARAARDGLALVELDGARHEPFFETPEIRGRLWAAIDAFLAERGI